MLAMKGRVHQLQSELRLLPLEAHLLGRSTQELSNALKQLASSKSTAFYVIVGSHNQHQTQPHTFMWTAGESTSMALAEIVGETCRGTFGATNILGANVVPVKGDTWTMGVSAGALLVAWPELTTSICVLGPPKNPSCW